MEQVHEQDDEQEYPTPADLRVMIEELVAIADWRHCEIWARVLYQVGDAAGHDRTRWVGEQIMLLMGRPLSKLAEPVGYVESFELGACCRRIDIWRQIMLSNMMHNAESNTPPGHLVHRIYDAYRRGLEAWRQARVL